VTANAVATTQRGEKVEIVADGEDEMRHRALIQYLETNEQMMPQLVEVR
jgi:phosphotransferase system HPr-like phosphotransfer protein